MVIELHDSFTKKCRIVKIYRRLFQFRLYSVIQNKCRIIDRTMAPQVNQNVDAIRNVISDLLEQSNEDDPSVLDKNQSFIQELLVNIHGKQVGIAAFLKQTLKNVMRFCTKKANAIETSPLCRDTTFHIAEYLVTQTTYQQLSVIRRITSNILGFPAPLLSTEIRSKMILRIFGKLSKEVIQYYRIYLSWDRTKTERCQERFCKKRMGNHPPSRQRTCC